MTDTWDQGRSDPDSLPPLTKAIVEANPHTGFGALIGPTAGDKPLRAMLDAIRSLEDRIIALEG